MDDKFRSYLTRLNNGEPRLSLAPADAKILKRMQEELRGVLDTIIDIETGNNPIHPKISAIHRFLSSKGIASKEIDKVISNVYAQYGREQNHL